MNSHENDNKTTFYCLELLHLVELSFALSFLDFLCDKQTKDEADDCVATKQHIYVWIAGAKWMQNQQKIKMRKTKNYEEKFNGTIKTINCVCIKCKLLNEINAIIISYFLDVFTYFSYFILFFIEIEFDDDTLGIKRKTTLRGGYQLRFHWLRFRYAKSLLMLIFFFSQREDWETHKVEMSSSSSAHYILLSSIVEKPSAVQLTKPSSATTRSS